MGEPVPGPLEPPRAAAACPLCGAPVTAGAERCPECNMTMAGVAGRAPMFTRQALWWWGGALLAVYLVVLAIVALAR
jgi:predicted nucleic acid-binding Zn ribbon protein